MLSPHSAVASATNNVPGVHHFLLLYPRQEANVWAIACSPYFPLPCVLAWDYTSPTSHSLTLQNCCKTAPWWLICTYVLPCCCAWYVHHNYRDRSEGMKCVAGVDKWSINVIPASHNAHGRCLTTWHKLRQCRDVHTRNTLIRSSVYRIMQLYTDSWLQLPAKGTIYDCLSIPLALYTIILDSLIYVVSPCSEG